MKRRGNITNICKCGEEGESNKGKEEFEGRKEWISNNLTKKEKRIEWVIKREAKRKRRG